jgi:lipopolysaccharide transport system permease protein
MATRVILEGGKANREYFKDLWRYRELLYVLAWRDISVRYKQTVAGIGWPVLRPALTTVVLTVIFGWLGKFPSDGVAYPVLVLAGMLPWQLLSAGLSESAVPPPGNLSHHRPGAGVFLFRRAGWRIEVCGQ